MPCKIAILIPTLYKREDSFNFIFSKISMQIQAAGLGKLIEITYARDNGHASTGHKRNHLLQSCSADYAAFVDDDDDVSDTYIHHLWMAACSGFDCASLGGIMTTDGRFPRQFVHSIQHDRYWGDDKCYYRPPNHLNLIKTEIGKQFTFPDKYISEDTEWAMQICHAKALKTEYPIPENIYFYKYKTQK